MASLKQRRCEATHQRAMPKNQIEAYVGLTGLEVYLLKRLQNWNVIIVTKVLRPKRNCYY